MSGMCRMVLDPEIENTVFFFVCFKFILPLLGTEIHLHLMLNVHFLYFCGHGHLKLGEKG